MSGQAAFQGTVEKDSSVDCMHKAGSFESWSTHLRQPTKTRLNDNGFTSKEIAEACFTLGDSLQGCVQQVCRSCLLFPCCCPCLRRLLPITLDHYHCQKAPNNCAAQKNEKDRYSNSPDARREETVQRMALVDERLDDSLSKLSAAAVGRLNTIKRVHAV